MNPITFWLSVAFFFWFVQQVNDLVNAFLNRDNVPKLFWLSAGASLISGAAMYYFLYNFVEGVLATFMMIFKAMA